MRYIDIERDRQIEIKKERKRERCFIVPIVKFDLDSTKLDTSTDMGTTPAGSTHTHRPVHMYTHRTH